MLRSIENTRSINHLASLLARNALWLWLLLLGGLAQAEETKPAPRAEVQVLFPGLPREMKKGGSPPARLVSDAFDSFLEEGGIKSIPASGELDAAALKSVRAVILDSRSIDTVSRWGTASLEALEDAVRGGLGFVVVGAAASALPASTRVSKLLGRREPPCEGPFLTRGDDLALELIDQSHPITQCVNHLIFTRVFPTAEAARDVTVLARAIRRRAPSTSPSASEATRESMPVFWVRQEGSGKVAVLALEVDRGEIQGEGQEGAGANREASRKALSREARALSLLVARGVQWAATGAVAFLIPDDLPLAAERLGPLDTGILPGILPRDGFYRGREIAPVMGFQGATWLQRPEREATELPEKMIDSLSIEKGFTVADLGAGVGYLTFRLARRVGASGKVIAVDLQEEMLRRLREQMSKEDIQNVETALATEVDPRLPEAAVDLVLMADVYHELSRPTEVLEAVKKSLKPRGPGQRSGRLALVEYRGEDPAVPIKPLHRTTVQQIRAELEPRGFELMERKEFLPHQHILIFEKK